MYKEKFGVEVPGCTKNNERRNDAWFRCATRLEIHHFSCVRYIYKIKSFNDKESTSLVREAGAYSQVTEIHLQDRTVSRFDAECKVKLKEIVWIFI